MIPVVMHQEGLDLQTAVDFVGDMCRQSIDRFIEEQQHLPSWGPEVDRDLAIYVRGLADWIVGSLHWSFETERYFGKNGRQVKATRVVSLLPRRPRLDAAALLPHIELPTPPPQPVSPIENQSSNGDGNGSVRRPSLTPSDIGHVAPREINDPSRDKVSPKPAVFTRRPRPSGSIIVVMLSTIASFSLALYLVLLSHLFLFISQVT